MFSPRYRVHYRHNFKIAYPVCLGQFGHVAVSVATSIQVGQTGPLPLAAVSLGNSFFMVIMLVGIGLSYGITPLVAAANGEKDFAKAGRVLNHGLVTNVIAGILLFMVLYSLVPLLHLLNQPAAVVALAIPYLNILILSMIPLMVFQAFRQFAEGLGYTRQAMFIILSSDLLDILLNYILIHGRFGFPAMGLTGAGWAAFISRVYIAAAMGIFVYFSPLFKPYRQRFSLAAIEAAVIKKILKIGIPAGAQFIFEVGAFSGAAIMIGWIGANELAAHQIAINMASITYMVATGISAAAVVRVGNYYGRKDRGNLRLAGFSSFMMAAMFMTLCGLIFIVGYRFLPALYIDDPVVIGIAGSLLIIGALFQISDGVQVVGLGTLRGIIDVKVPTAITFIAYWVIGLPVGYVLSRTGFGAQGIWLGLCAGLSVSAVFLVLRFNYRTKRIFGGKEKGREVYI